MKGFATAKGTENYKQRFAGKLAEGHFRQKQNLWFSSIGIGSYLGASDDETDVMYEAALKAAVSGGVNVIDTAINYRSQRSERSFGRALKELVNAGAIDRDEIILCTKAGFIPFDGEIPGDPMEYFKRTYIETGILKPEDVVEGCHAMTPSYLDDQLQRSLNNLGVETIDIFYLHNPETQLAQHEPAEFLKRMRAAFEWMEKKVSEGKIKIYGTATWNAYRSAPEAADHLSIEELMVIAREIAGAKHHFRAVQLPLNLAMPQAWVSPTQPFAANRVPFLGIAHRLDLIVIGSASLLQSRLTGELPVYLDPYFKQLPKSSQRAIQFARSVPGITTALVGMKNLEHVRENLETAKVPPLSENQLFSMFQNVG